MVGTRDQLNGDAPAAPIVGDRLAIEHPHHGTFKMAGWPVRFNGKPPAVKRAPLLGEHSGEALKDWLGMTDNQVAALRDDKII